METLGIEDFMRAVRQSNCVCAFAGDCIGVRAHYVLKTSLRAGPNFELAQILHWNVSQRCSDDNRRNSLKGMGKQSNRITALICFTFWTPFVKKHPRLPENGTQLAKKLQSKDSTSKK
jgi:hypothetical protein